MNIIDEPGDYRTRDGGFATIHEISGESSFPAKGHIIIYQPGKNPRRYFQTWKPNGQFSAHGEHRHDIVSKVRSLA